MKLNYMDSTTLPVTFALDGSAAKLDDILKWETAMKEYLLEQIGRRPDLKIAFSTDRALEVGKRLCWYFSGKPETERRKRIVGCCCPLKNFLLSYNLKILLQNEHRL